MNGLFTSLASTCRFRVSVGEGHGGPDDEVKDRHDTPDEETNAGDQHGATDHDYSWDPIMATVILLSH